MPADTINTMDLAAEVGVSRQMIGKWSREGLVEAARIARGKWDREKALSWIADRREDSVNFQGTGPSSAELLEARIRLYSAQAQGADIRNRAAEAELVKRSAAAGAFAEVSAEQVGAGDAWARDSKTPACDELRALISEPAIIKLKSELWNELRGRMVAAVEHVGSRLATGEDMGATRIRISGSVGGR